jgi:hypothetical protein
MVPEINLCWKAEIAAIAGCGVQHMIEREI